MTDYQRIEKVIRHLDQHYREQPGLSELAGVAGLSEFHFHRLFSRWAGTTPKSFLQLLTARHAKRLLNESRDLLTASLDAGLSGPGRLHDLMVKVEGMSPGEFKSGGSGVEIAHGFHETPFGLCLIGLTQRGICHMAFVDDRAQALDQSLQEMKKRWPRALHIANDSDALSATSRVASQIFAPASLSEKSQPLSVLLSGTPFQLQVWEALLRIPAGRAVTYGDLAQSIDRPSASRAVGTAVGANPVAFLIPCHRVIRETGIIGEYRWGSERKKAILAKEWAKECAEEMA